VPAGDFVMGSNQNYDTQADRDEVHQHIVTLSAFWIDQTLVTNTMYASCVTAGGCSSPGSTSSATRLNYYGGSQYANYPVINVNWSQAVAYCQWAGRRLPTEAEWEKAARGTDGRIYPWGKHAPDATLGNFNKSVGDTSQVGIYPAGASPYGALDMMGNVWEWVADWYSNTYYLSSPARNPTGPDSGTSHVMRGGSWFSGTDVVSAFQRGGNIPSYRSNYVGFRCAN
jgi:formylglycine-generating enzyme required for sulfatase activity